MAHGEGLRDGCREGGEARGGGARVDVGGCVGCGCGEGGLGRYGRVGWDGGDESGEGGEADVGDCRGTQGE